MTDLVSRLTSRKLWIAVAALITCAANKQWNEFMAIAIGYITTEGAKDAVAVYRQKPAPTPRQNKGA